MTSVSEAEWKNGATGAMSSRRSCSAFPDFSKNRKSSPIVCSEWDTTEDFTALAQPTKEGHAHVVTFSLEP